MTGTSFQPHKIDGLSAIVDRYRGVILDLWGVVHNGVHALPGAVDVLVRLRDAAVPVCLLSNAPRRVDTVARQLADLGVDPALYTYLVTSGELTFDHMRTGLAETAYFHLGPSFLASLGNGSGCREVDSLDAADFILCTGTDRVEAIDELLPTLHTALGLGLPMLCANPDREVLIGDQRVLCAGAIARTYSALGGGVRGFGKPHPQVYDHVLGLLDVEADEALAIGDGFATDVLGANRAGIDAVFVSSGIHCKAFDADGDPLARASWHELADRFGASPRYSFAHLCW